MAELRSVNPRALQFNPNNPRRTPVPPAMDKQLVASIKAVGIIQPPSVTQKNDERTVVVGNRRMIGRTPDSATDGEAPARTRRAPRCSLMLVAQHLVLRVPR
jgi:hypothetical protein